MRKVTQVYECVCGQLAADWKVARRIGCSRCGSKKFRRILHLKSAPTREGQLVEARPGVTSDAPGCDLQPQLADAAMRPQDASAFGFSGARDSLDRLDMLLQSQEISEEFFEVAARRVLHRVVHLIRNNQHTEERENEN